MDTAVVTFTQHYTDVVNTKYGAKTKNTFVTDDGERYESWNSGIAAKVAAGMDTPLNIVFERKVSGQYTNLEIKDVLGGSALVPQEPQTQTTTNAPVPQAQPSESAKAKDTRISRLAALKVAAIEVTAEGISFIENPTVLFERAEEILNYVDNGLPVEAEA